MSFREVRIRRSILIGVLFFSLIALGCQPKSNSEQQSLRVRNAGALAVKDLVVIFPEDRIAFGDIAPGEVTVYQEVPHGVYRYAAYKLELDGETFEQPVVDWMGETPMSGRKFTYVIALDPSKPYFNTVGIIEVTRDK